MVYGLLEDFHGEKPSRIFRLGTKKEKKFQKKDTLRQEVLNSHFLDNLHIYVVRERKLRREERQKRRESKVSKVKLSKFVVYKHDRFMYCLN